MVNYVFISKNKFEMNKMNNDFNYYIRFIGYNGYVPFKNKKFIYIHLLNECKLIFFENNKKYLIIFNNYNDLIKCDKNKLIAIFKYDDIIFEKIFKSDKFIEVFI